MTVREAIENWVEGYQEKKFKQHVAASIAYTLAGILVLWVTWWGVRWTLWFGFSAMIGTGLGLHLGTLLVILVLFVVYMAINHQELHYVELGDPEQTEKVRELARKTGTGVLSKFGNQEILPSIFQSFSVTLFAVPAVTLKIFWHAHQARKIQKLRADFVAPFLIKLAKADTRIPMEKLAEDLQNENMAEFIEQMSLIEGVTIRTQGNVGMYLSEQLKADLTAARDERKS